MADHRRPRAETRYHGVSQEKSGGATYTPGVLADFVARHVVQAAVERSDDRPTRVLDPALGDGELLVNLLQHLRRRSIANLQVHGFETDSDALEVARSRVLERFPDLKIDFRHGDFLDFVIAHFGTGDSNDLFRVDRPGLYDLVIANPPYVRNQIMGARQTRIVAKRFGLAGRADLYYAFILGIARVLEPDGTAGLIVSNRFMTIRSGAVVRRALLERLQIRRAWDLGDTKLFDAAVLPAVLILQGKVGRKTRSPAFTSIYQTSRPADRRVANPISALDREGLVRTDDGRSFRVHHGRLDTDGTADGVWRLATRASDAWLATVAKHRSSTFLEVGKVRVGVKTCADSVFIRNDWRELPGFEYPELLRPLITHHTARRFKPDVSARPLRILYPHETVRGRRRAVDLTKYPRSRAYLEAHRSTLENRRYVKNAGREWYEIWVPQDPDVWRRPKLVFRDIAERPTFLLDLDRSVVNGDCYWLVCHEPARKDLLWLAAAVGNSTFVERFYDYRFHNKLYSGRRRFMTQYVEQFPLPDPSSPLGKEIITKSKALYDSMPSPADGSLQEELNAMVWDSFGLSEEVDR